MKRIAGLQQRFGFTESEIRVIVFLVLSLLAGTAIRWLRASDGRTTAPPAFDYARIDSEFAARSRIPPPDDPPSRAARQHRTPALQKQTLAPGSIDINSATKEELILLPGIGEAFAERIILYRDDHGPFAAVDGLRAVRGIGPATLAKIRPFVTAGTPH
jgi:competence ComEA-like helix-hairpin-helix protein